MIVLIRCGIHSKVSVDLLPSLETLKLGLIRVIWNSIQRVSWFLGYGLKNKIFPEYFPWVVWLRRIRPPVYGVSDLYLDKGTFRAYGYKACWLFGYGVLGSLGTAYWLFGYGELAENVLLMIFDQSIIYGVSADVDTTYSSKSGNGLVFFKVIRYGV
ncbi:hypothetical protein Tco_0748924 [Tanacetum coccineum]|uniref:Uncharacterized protein n=1 Tax=Tanacetum coccineum TaxID=301880 RepID=A0ABQ4YZZ2_9ASTR